MKVESGYPKSVLTDWMGCEREDSTKSDGTEEEVIIIEVNKSDGFGGVVAIVLPIILLACLLILLGVLMFFRHYGTPKRLLYFHRSLLDRV